MTDDETLKTMAAAHAAFPEAWDRLHQPSEGWESEKDMARDFFVCGYFAANSLPSADTGQP